MTKLLLSSLLLLFTTFAVAQIPGPDSTFGRFGAAWSNVYPSDDQALAVVIRTDGRAVVAGRTTIDSVPQMAVFQYKTDGSLDLDFHWNGKGALTFNTSPAAAHALAIDAEGRVVLAGYVTENGNEQFSIVRLLPDGTYDATFGTNGWVITDFNGGNDQANAVAVQPDGKIVAAGFTRNGTDADFALARYLPDGSLDASFGTGGRVVTKIDLLADIIRDMTIASNGKIVVCGTTLASQVFNTPSFFAVARYLSDGSLDLAFGSGGKVVTDIGADEESDIARAVTLLPTGQIVVAGYSSISLASKISVVRYRPTGLLDTSFGDLGVAQTTVFNNSGNFCTDIAALPDNSLVLSGMAENVDFKDVFLVKMRDNGTVDPTFGQSGKVVRSLSPKDDNTYGSARRPDGRILVVGDTRKEGDFYTDATLLQFNADGSKDATFGTDGVKVEDVGTSEDNGSAVWVQPDGKILVGGVTSNNPNFSRPDWAILRLNPNGQADNTFGENGTVAYDFSGGFDRIGRILSQQPSKIVAAGDIDASPALVRFDPKGNLDPAFGTLGKAILGLSRGSFLYDMMEQPDNKILAVATQYLSPSTFRATLFRFSADGQLDSGFGQNGKVESAALNQEWTSIALLPDGQIVVAGHLLSSLNNLTVNQFMPNGAPDLSFAQNGEASFPIGPLWPKIQIQKDGKMLFAGDNKMLRLNPNGTLDTGFGTGGEFIAQEKIDFTDLKIQQDKRIVLTGITHLNHNDASQPNFVVARFNSDGSADNGWGQNGFLRLRGRASYAAAFDSDGNILASGSIHNGERSDIVVYRLLRGEYVGTVDRPDEAGSRILNVFPNPVAEYLTLEYDLVENQEVAIKMYDAGGRLLHTLLSGAPRFSGKNAERIALPAGLPAGMYTVTVETGRGSVAVQVMVR